MNPFSHSPLYGESLKQPKTLSENLMDRAKRSADVADRVTIGFPNGGSRDFYLGKAEAFAIAARDARPYVKALQTIASYSDKNNPGCCVYGCDTPSIAQDALGGKGGA